MMIEVLNKIPDPILEKWFETIAKEYIERQIQSKVFKE